MNKDQVQELMLGAVVAVLAYALYKHFKAPAAGQPSTPYGQKPMGFAVGEPTAQSRPNPFTNLNDLLTGAVHDIGGYQGQDYLATMGDPLIYGNNGQDSIVKAGGYW